MREEKKIELHVLPVLQRAMISERSMRLDSLSKSNVSRSLTNDNNSNYHNDDREIYLVSSPVLENMYFNDMVHKKIK